MSSKNNLASFGAESDLFKQALEAAADAVVITDKKGDIIWVNQAFETLTGYTADEVLEKNPRLLKSNKQAPGFYKDLWSTISAGQVWHGELWNRRKNSEMYLEGQSITPVKNSAGKITHYIAIKRNITNQYQLQNQLNMAQRIEAIGKLTGGVAHNFNNKLATILGYAELASEEAEQYSNFELTDYLKEISIAGKLARDLVRQMMAFSRNDINKIELVDLSEVIKSTVKILSSTLPSSIKIMTRIQNLPMLRADPIRLHQILLSLAINASEAMNCRGVIIIGSHTEQVNDCTCHSCNQSFSGEYVVITIHDAGKGIKLGDIEKIFFPFFTTKEFEGGTGMGLAALHGMLHDQHGHVVVDSKVGEFTLFNIYLPVDEKSNIFQEKHDDYIDSHKNTDHKLTKPCHILVVDDELAVANVLAELLRNMGYEVSVETNSKKAMALYFDDYKKFNLIITDNSMPFMTGIELSEAIYEVNKQCPVILMTGSISESIDYKPSNIKAILTKPFETIELNTLIKSII